MLDKYAPNGVEWKSLGELGTFYSGLTGKSKDDFTDGNAVLISYKNVYANPAADIHPDDRVKIVDGEKQRILQYGDVIFTGSSETPDECGFSSVVTEAPSEPLYLNSFCFFLRFHNLSGINPDYLKHLFRSYDLRKQIGRTASGVTRFNVSKEKMEKVTIPIPPLEVQNAIVEVLDKFSVLCNDISVGIPAEIELRKQQYSYWREKLLSFENIA